MDLASLLVGIAVGAAFGLSWLVVVARGHRAAARAAEAFHDKATEGLRGDVAAERRRADDLASRLTKVHGDLRAKEAALVERERAIEEKQRIFDDSTAKLSDVFKASGADVLNITADRLLEQAKRQFESQRELSQRSFEATMKPLAEQLAKQEQLVTKLGEAREGDRRSLEGQLRAIADLQQQASQAAQSLSGALRDNRRRGRWGEVGLRTVVELAGLAEGVHFTQQQTLDGAEGRLRPDMVVQLPGGRVIPVDSKVPLESYLAALEQDCADERRASLRHAHASAVRAHVRALARKEYAAEVAGDIEFTVLYIEVESAFTAALETDPSIHQDAMDRRVLVVTPSTLLALLRTVAMHWSESKFNARAAEVRDEAKVLVERVGVLVRHLNVTGQRLTGLVESFNKAVGSFDRMFVPQLNKVASFVALPALELEDGPADVPRHLDRPELPDPGESQEVRRT